MADHKIGTRAEWQAARDELAKLVLHNPPSRATNHGARRRAPHRILHGSRFPPIASASVAPSTGKP